MFHDLAACRLGQLIWGAILAQEPHPRRAILNITRFISFLQDPCSIVHMPVDSLN